MRTNAQVRSLRTLHPGWTAVTAVVVILGVVGTLSELWRFVGNGEWWNLPGVVAGGLLTYWVGVPAWRLARAGRGSVQSEPHSGPAGSQ